MTFGPVRLQTALAYSLTTRLPAVSEGWAPSKAVDTL
jgi:hypothetical protein